MNKINYLIVFSVALFCACSDSPNVTGTTEIDNTVAQDGSSSSTEQGSGNSSSSVSGQQSSSSAPQSSSSSTRSFKFGTCLADGFEPQALTKRVEIQALAKRTSFTADIEGTSEEQPKAYIINDEENYQVFIQNVLDYCSVKGVLETTRSGDTLEIEYGGIPNENGEFSMAVSACVCYSDHWFDINAEDKNIKFVKYKSTIYKISDDPVPEPSTHGGPSTQKDSTSTQIDSTSTQSGSTFTDTRDGKTYRTVQIGERIWMAENLNYEIKDSLVSNCDENGGCDMGFPNNRPQSWCNGNKQENCDKYGRLYNLEAAKVACPSGWSLPEVKEWPEKGNGGFSAFLDYAVVGWGGGKDSYGFSILPAGDYTARSQYFLEPGRFAFFWTSTIDPLNHNCATMIHVGNGSEGIVSVCADDENDGLSVRCVKD